MLNSWNLKDVSVSASKSFFVYACAFLVGVLSASLNDERFLGTPEFTVLGAAAILAAAFFWCKANYRLVFIAVFFLLAGAWRFQLSFPPNQVLEVFSSAQERVMTGKVIDIISVSKISQNVLLADVVSGDEKLFGKTIVRTPLYPVLDYADKLTFRCALQNPADGSAAKYEKYFAAQGIYFSCQKPSNIEIEKSSRMSVMSVLQNVKRSAIGAIEKEVPEPHSGLLSGLLFGGSRRILSDLKEDFIKTGTAHILAASGYNISVFTKYLFIALVTLAFYRRTALILVSAFVVLYVLMAGLEPSIVRAGIMALVVIFGGLFGRKGLMRNIIALTAVLMLFINPKLLLSDVGFQLSFSATLGLIYLLPKLEPYFDFIPIRAFKEALATTMSATLASFPIIVWQFGAVSLVSPIVNLFVLPLVPFAMLFGFLIIAATYAFEPLVKIFSTFAWAILFLIVNIISWFGALPFSSSSVGHRVLFVVIWAIGMISFFVWKKEKPFALKKT